MHRIHIRLRVPHTGPGGIQIPDSKYPAGVGTTLRLWTDFGRFSVADLDRVGDEPGPGF